MCKSAKYFSLVLLLAVLPATAADVAVLRNGFTIRHERRQELGETTRLYLTADGNSYTDVPTAEIDHFEADSSPAPIVELPPAPVTASTSTSVLAPSPKVDLKDVVASASNTHRIDPDLINSVIHAESGFNPHAISPKGARGLMQLMPQTANRLGVKNSFDPRDNVDGGTRYLRELLELYNFDLIKALAAYNAGPQRVQQYHGVPPYRETRAYVRRIILDFNRKKVAEEKAAKQVAGKSKTVSSTSRASSAKQRTAKPASPVRTAELPGPSGP